MIRDTNPPETRRIQARLGMLLAFLASAGILVAATSPGRNATAARRDATSSHDPALADLRATGRAFASVTRAVRPAVVFIQVQKGDPRRAGQPRSPFPSPPLPDPAAGSASGFLFSKEGHILTNRHVVGGANALTVKLADGRSFDAQVVGTDAHTDVAVIKIEGTNLPTLSLGDSDAIEVGQWALAIGSPFGLVGSVTSGIVSAKGRNHMGITNYENFIQTDAAINPGNSGGPLVNLSGEAIGMNTAIFSRTGGSMGIGFAIPINMARRIADQLIAKGEVTRGYLGIAIQEMTSELAHALGLKETKGVLVGSVQPDSPAAKAGLQAGDLIVRFQGKPVSALSAFRNRVAQTSPGNPATMAVVRNGKHLAIFATVTTWKTNR